MATLTIRDLPEDTRQALKTRAAENNRSMEAEVREILQSSVTPQNTFVIDWMTSTARLRGDFEVPARSAARPVSLS